MDATNLAVLSLVIVIVVAANLGERTGKWRAVVYAVLAIPGVGTLSLGLVYLLLAAVQHVLPTALPAPAMADLGEINLGRIGVWLTVGGLLSWVVLLPPVRRGLARLIPIRPDSMANAVALALLAILLAHSLALGGLGPQGLVALTGQLSVLQVVLSEVPLALAGAFGVGLFIRRTPRETWERLGIQGLTRRQVGLSLAGVVGLLAFEVAVNAIAARISPEQFEQLSRSTEHLYARLGTPLAAVTVSLAAGTAEEILFRGALQPRFGLLLTTIVFGVVHMQYGLLFALLSIGGVGLVLGLYRQRINTTSSILIHSLYNLVLFLFSGL